jgi:hypothetical protein
MMILLRVATEQIALQAIQKSYIDKARTKKGKEPKSTRDEIARKISGTKD